MNIRGYIWRRLLSAVMRGWMRANGIRCGRKLIIYGAPIVEKHKSARIVLGDRVVLCSKADFTALGVSRPVILRAMAPNSRIEIGNDVGISGASICAREAVVVGPNCLLGADVIISDTDFHPIDAQGRRYATTGIKSAPITIGSNVFLGARTIVLKGVAIGDNSVIGAGSVVTGSIPANSIAAGNPCRVLRHLPDVP